MSVTDNNMVYSGIYYHSFAKRAAARLFYVFAGIAFYSDEIHCAAEHLISRRAYNGIHLGVYTAAKLISLAARNIKPCTDTVI